MTLRPELLKVYDKINLKEIMARLDRQSINQLFEVLKAWKSILKT